MSLPRCTLAVVSSPSVKHEALEVRMARVLFIVNRDHPELLASLQQEFAAQEAAGLAAIFSDRRQGPGPSNPAPHAYDDHRRDRQRNADRESRPPGTRVRGRAPFRDESRVAFLAS